MVDKNDRRFEESLRGRWMTLWDLLHCQCRCFGYGRVLGDNPEDLSRFDGSRPRRSVLKGYCSANGLRKTVVKPC